MAWKRYNATFVRRSVAEACEPPQAASPSEMARAKAAAVRSRGLALAALFIGALLAVAQGAAVRKLTDGALVVAHGLRRCDAVLANTVRPLAQTPSSTRRRRPRARRQAYGLSGSSRRGVATASSSNQSGVGYACCIASRHTQAHARVSASVALSARDRGSRACVLSKLVARRAEKLAAELEGEVAVAEVDATSSKGVLTRFAEAGLVRGYPTLLLFRCAAVNAPQSAWRCD